MAKKKRERSLPLPGAIDGSEDWQIRESPFGAANVDASGRVMTVSLGITPEERQQRNHEMLHVKFSPKKPPALPRDVDALLYQACEDMRIHRRGAALGMDPDRVRNLTERDIQQWRKAWEGDPLTAAAALASTVNRNVNDADMIWRAIREDFPDKYNRIIDSVYEANYQYFNRANCGPKSAVNAASFITNYVGPRPKDGDDDKKDGKDGHSDADVNESLEHIMDREAAKKLAQHEMRNGDAAMDRTVAGARWGELHQRDVPFTLSLPPRMRKRAWKPTDQGSVFRYPHRYCGDGTVFAHRGIKEGGATLLVDVSGSMDFSESDILKVMEYLPAAVIATYSGNGAVGALTIVARKGRRCEESLFRKWGGNVIDGPALEWLAKQPGPRFWVSDGGVTGRNDDYFQHPALVADCVRICRKAKILRIHSMHDVEQHFKELRLSAGAR